MSEAGEGSTVNEESSVNFEDVERYFKFLDPKAEDLQGSSAWFTYAWFDPQSIQPVPGYGVCFGQYAKIAQEIQEFVEQRATQGKKSLTLHTTLNQTSDKGRKKKDVQSVRVFCLDIDLPWVRTEVKKFISEYAPQLVVESSPDKFHFYWKASPTVSLDDWAAIQAGIAAHCGGDMCLANLEKMIRVPGIRRMCKNGELGMPRIVVDSGDREERGVAQMDELFGVCLREIGVQGLEAERKRQKGIRKLAAGTVKSTDGGVEIITTDFIKLAAKIGTGARNEGLYSATNSYVYTMGLNGVGPMVRLEEALGFAMAVNAELVAPLGRDEVEKTATSAWEHAAEGLRRGRERSEKEVEEIKTTSQLSHRGTEQIPEFVYDFKNDRFMHDRFSDRAGVARVFQRFGHCMIRTGEIRHAFDFDERVWRKQEGRGHGGIIRSFCEECLLDTINDPEFKNMCCADGKGKITDKKVQEKRNSFLTNDKIATTAREVYENERIKRMDIRLFDSVPTIIYAKQGVFDMKTKNTRDAQPQDYLWQRTNVNWNPKAECPRWLKFLEEVFALGDTSEEENTKYTTEMIRFMQELFGYSLTGYISEDKVFVHTGEGCNGKSKTLTALAKIAGGYCSLLDCHALTKKKSAAQTAFDRLGPKIEGKRVIIIDDLETKTQWNEGFIKSLTAKTIPCRFLYEEQKDIPNRCKFHIGCNEVPDPETENHGIARRICIIPYHMRFKQNAKKGDEIDSMIDQELEGILRWAVEGAQRMMKNGGIVYPKSLETPMEEYTQEHFKIEDVVKRCFEVPSGPDAPGPDEKVSLEKLTLIVNEEIHLIDKFHPRVTEIYLGRLLTAKGFKSQRGREGNLRTRYYYVKIHNLNQKKSGPDDLL